MKLIYQFFLALSLVFASCSSDEPGIMSDDADAIQHQIKFEKRTPDEAIALAEALSKRDAKFYARSFDNTDENVKVVDKSSLKVLGRNKSRSGTLSDTLIYAINYKDNNGFVLVSANRNTEPILAIIDHGTYEEGSSNGNLFFENYLRDAEDFVAYSVGVKPIIPPVIEPDDILLMWKTDTISSFSCQTPNIKVQWNQYWPANMFCQNKIAGCTPLAIAQALTYLRSISSLQITFSGAEETSIPLDWDDILKHKNGIYTSNHTDYLIGLHMNECQTSERSHKNIGYLVRQIGDVMHSNYYINHPVYGTSTGTEIRFIQLGINAFFPNKKIVHYSSSNGSNSSISNTFDYMYNYKDAIAIISCTNKDSYGNYIDGHTWVADATAQIRRLVMTYYNYNVKTGEYTHSECEESILDRYLHFNWGWNGACDGYYLISVLEPGFGLSTVTPGSSIPSGGNMQYYKAYQDVYCVK